jgi:hypothetical protein
LDEIACGNFVETLRQLRRQKARLFPDAARPPQAASSNPFQLIAAFSPLTGGGR